MENNPSLARFENTLGTLFNKCQQGLDSLQVSFVSTNDNERVESARHLEETLSTLSELLHDTHRPKWVAALLRATTIFASSPTPPNATNLLNTIIKYRNVVKPITFDPGIDEGSPFDFDGLFDSCKEEERLGELFDAHIESVSRIIESDEIEHLTILESLRTLVRVLKANRDGSYVAVRQAVWISEYVKNVVFVALKKSKTLDVLIKAAELTHKQVSSGLNDIDKIMTKEIDTQLHERLPRIDQAAEIVNQTYAALPPPAATTNADD